MSKKALGRGLSALFNPTSPLENDLLELGIEQIEPNQAQPRRVFNEEKLEELAASIRANGLIQPIIVRRDGESFQIIAGERRWRASQIAGLTEVPCIEVDTDERGVAEIALIENLQRKDLNIWEEADGLKSLSEKFGYTQDEIARKISKSRTTVTELMTVAGLPQEIRDRCRERNINSKSTLIEIARQFDDEAMLKRMPRGFSEDHKAAKWLRYQSFTAGRVIPDAKARGAAFPSFLEKEFVALLPLVRWLNGALGLSTRQ